jgi:hypothetical protein
MWKFWEQQPWELGKLCEQACMELILIEMKFDWKEILFDPRDNDIAV